MMNGLSKVAGSGTLKVLIFLATAIVAAKGHAQPVVADDSYSTDEDSPLVVAAPGVLVNDTGGANHYVEAVDLTPGYTPGLEGMTASGAKFTLYADGSFEYDPGDLFDYLPDGVSVLDGVFATRYLTNDDDGNISPIANIFVTVNGVNDLPSFGGSAVGSITEDAALATSGALTITDVDDDEDAFEVETIAGTYGSLEITNESGFWTYTIDNTPGSATDLLVGGEVVTDIFTIQTKDSSGATTLVTITVTGANDVPVFGGINAASITEDTVPTVASALTISDSDAGQGAFVTGIQPGTYGSLEITSASGAWTYTIDNTVGGAADLLIANEVVTDVFTIATDDIAGTTTAITITVTGANDLPVIGGVDTGAITEDDAASISDALTITDPDNGEGSFTTGIQTGVYGELNVTGAAGSWIYTIDNTSGSATDKLAAGAVVTDVFTINTADSAMATATITVTVTGANDSPVVSDQSMTIEENLAEDNFVIALGATDPDAGETFIYEITAGMAGDQFQVDANGNILVGDHRADVELLNFEEESSYVLTVLVTDSGGLTDTALISVTLSDEPDPPGKTLCEEFDEFSVSLGLLDADYGPIKSFYNFTEADPCHRIVEMTDDYYMEQGKKIIASDTDPLAEDTAQVNYRISLNNNGYDLDQDSGTFFYTSRQNITDLLALVDFENEAGTSTESGEFIYTPPAALNSADDGVDHFVYRVCDDAVDESEAHCALGIVIVDSSATAAAGVATSGTNLADDLSQGPLELPVASVPNVFVLLDDSGSMDWDMLTDQSSGLFYLYPRYRIWFLPGDGRSRRNYAYTESYKPGKGLWKLRNSTYNKVYYDPTVTYFPWIGLDNRGALMGPSDPAAARSNPYRGSSQKYNLTSTIRLNSRDRNVRVSKYYKWTDIDDPVNCPGNVVGVVDGTSPHTSPGGTCTEGTLVEIKSSVPTYDKASTRTDCAGATCTYTEEIQNFANFYSYARTRHYASKSAVGKVIAEADNMRIGYGAFNGVSDNLNIEEMNESALTGNKGDLLNHLYRSNASGGTPMRRSLERTGRYYECLNSNTIITAGRTCPILPAPEGNCQQNFTLLIGDGYWNGNGPSNNISNDDTNSSNLFDGGRYADGYSDTLADIAMYFYERDLSPLDDEVPANERDLAGAPASAFGGSSSSPTMHQHMSTFVISFGVTGNVDPDDIPADYTETFAWGNVNSTSGKLDDMVHTALNGRGEYLSANDPTELADALESSFEAFTQAIGTASAVSFNSQEIQQDSIIYRAFYNIRENTGDLVAQEFDTEGALGDEVWSAAEELDGKTHLERNILTFDPTVVNGEGGIPFRFANLTAAQKLALEDDVPNVIVENSAEFDAQITKHVNYLRGDRSSERPLGNLRERPAVKGRLGDFVNSTPVFYGKPGRLRRDFPPYSLAKPYRTFASSNASRQPVVYVGANDGMVHAFNADDGEEMFAFMPNNIITGNYSEGIKQLLSTSYSHRYTVDLSLAINDVFVDTDRRSDTFFPEKDWATILIGGYRAGGKGYFALDVTDPVSVTEANADGVVMWEFTDEDDVHPVVAPLLDPLGFPISDVGFSFSSPTIAMSNVSDTTTVKDNEWVAVFGNGYNSTSGKAVLYVLFVGGGTDGTWCHPDKPEVCTGTYGDYDFIKIETPAVNASVKNGLGTPRGIDLDGNGTIDIAYAGDRFGNLYRFDLRDPDPTNWDATLVAQASFGSDTQPITTQPLVVTHPTVDGGANCYAYNEEEVKVERLCGGYIVIFGTGSYIFEGDDTSQDIQSIYGVWDRLGNITVTKDDLVEQEFTAISGDENVGSGRVLSENTVDYSTKAGWYIDFDHPPATAGVLPEFPGEKAIRNIQLRGGIVFVNSVIPKTNLSCTTEAGGAANVFCPDTGNLACSKQFGVYDVDNDGDYDASDLTTAGKKLATVFFEDHVPTDSTFFGGDRVTQLSDQTLDVRHTDTSDSANTGRISWGRLKSNVE